MIYFKQEGLRDCGICCMQNIIRYYGGYIDIEKLREMTETNENGTSIYNILKVSNQIGFTSKAYKCEINDLHSLKFPLMALIKLKEYNHFVILNNIEVDKVQIFDPIRGKIIYKLDEFIDVWQNIVITFYKSGEIVKDKNCFNNYISNIFYENKVSIIIGIIMSIICSILGIISSIFIKKICDGNFSNSILIIFMILILLKSIVEYFRSNMSILLTNKLDYTLSNKVYTKIFSLPLVFHHSRPLGDTTSKINDLYSIENFISMIILYSFIDLLIVLFILFIILFTNFRIFLIVLFLSFLYTYIYYFSNNKERNLINDNKEKNSVVNSSIIDNIMGIDTIKNLNIEDKIINKQSNNIKNYLYSKQKIFSFYSFQNFIFSFIESYGTLIILFIGYNFTKDSVISLGNLIFIYTLFIMYFSSFKNLFLAYKYYLDSKISYKRINKLLNIKQNNDCSKSVKIIDTIKFNNVSYSYNSNNIVSKFNLLINRGDYILVSGESGKGKSTLFKLLNKELALKSGIIYINDINIDEIKTSSIRNNICYVSQNEHIFNDSIKNNVLMYKNSSKKDLDRALKVSTLDSVLKRRKISLDYLLENNGSNLSGGERQKILIARTLLRGTNCIVFDETMNEIDIETEKKIINGIKSEYDKTVILISHRNSNNNLFNKKVVI